MAELWALLHFIMPTLFDSHDEFNEWFSKDIESHAENKTGIDESKYEVSLLHCILMTDTMFIKMHNSNFQVVVFMWLFNVYWLCIVLLQHCVREEILDKCCTFQWLCVLCAGFVTNVDVLMVTD
jgi:hypothetical protein